MISQEQLEVFNLQTLPKEIKQLLQRFDQIPPRLFAHLVLVHDVAYQLVNALSSEWPNLTFDKEAILFGAASHDIGKIKYPAELTRSGTKHEEAGYMLLIEANTSPQLARFARTHGQRDTSGKCDIEDLLVALADKCWKGIRDERLEQHIIELIAEKLEIEKWEVFVRFDDIIDKISSTAHQRLSWQAQFSVIS